MRAVKKKIVPRLQGLGAQPDSKWQMYGKAEPFRTTGGGAVPNNDGLVAALLRCVTTRPISHFPDEIKKNSNNQLPKSLRQYKESSI